MLVSHLSLRSLDSAFLSLSPLDILTILRRKLRSHISRRLVILVVAFHVSKAYKATEGKLQVYSWSVTFRPTTLDPQRVWSCLKLNRLRWLFFSRLFLMSTTFDSIKSLTAFSGTVPGIHLQDLQSFAFLSY